MIKTNKIIEYLSISKNEEGNGEESEKVIVGYSTYDSLIIIPMLFVEDGDEKKEGLRKLLRVRMDRNAMDERMDKNESILCRIRVFGDNQVGLLPDYKKEKEFGRWQELISLLFLS